MDDTRQKQTISSALWAAYGDALGFPTELVNEDGVKRRIGARRIEKPISWKRLVGGKFGAWATLGAGTYSDDTQLRLATSRAIRGDGHFDVEAFAKVELPVWLTYCLGAGRGSKLGATSLGQKNVTWFSNFFEQRDLRYVDGGGNGAAMRINPHVWVAKDLTDPDTYLYDVIRNALCTHGHPRGIAGAVFYAVCLANVLLNSQIPDPKDWKDLGLYAHMTSDYIKRDPDLSAFWLPTWNAKTSKSFFDEMERVRLEWETDVELCIPLLDREPYEAYESIIDTLGGFTPEQRGSGLKCALFALVAAWIFRKSGPEDAIIAVANLLSSDTDTIGTMVGALLGAAFPHQVPQEPLQDNTYIAYDAKRLYLISQGQITPSFQYPDLLIWQPPRTQLDGIGIANERVALAGLGWAEALDEGVVSQRSEFMWQWFRLDFGQTVLCKRRTNLLPLAKNSLPAVAAAPEGYTRPTQLEKARAKPIRVNSPDLFQNEMHEALERKRTKNFEIQGNRSRSGEHVQNDHIARDINMHSNQSKTAPLRDKGNTLDSLTDNAIRSGFDPTIIGTDLLYIAQRPDGIELAVAYSAIIVKARQARLKHGKE